MSNDFLDTDSGEVKGCVLFCHLAFAVEECGDIFQDGE